MDNSVRAHAAVDSLAEKADEAARKAKPAIERAAALGHQAVDKAAEAGESLKATQDKLMKDTCDYVSANPVKSVAMAAVAGFVLSRFLL